MFVWFIAPSSTHWTDEFRDDASNIALTHCMPRSWIMLDILSGKHTKNCGTSPFLMGKLTLSMAMFYVANYKRLPGRVSLLTIAMG